MSDIQATADKPDKIRLDIDDSSLAEIEKLTASLKICTSPTEYDNPIEEMKIQVVSNQTGVTPEKLTIPSPEPIRISTNHINKQSFSEPPTQRLKITTMREESVDASMQQSHREQSQNNVSGSKRDTISAAVLAEEEISKFYGVFTVNKKQHRFSINSLYCMTQKSKLRNLCVHIVVNKWFDRFIIFCILINSLGLASKEYDERFDTAYDSEWNKILDQLDLAFSIIFLIECILKVIAMGFIKHKAAYLRDAWNWIDFIIVVVSVIGFTPISNDSSMKAFRTMRILRPLRSMHKLESMRNLLNTFFASIPGLFNVCLFQMFFFTIFAIVAVNFFLGAQYQFCRTTEEMIFEDGKKPVWPINEDAAWQCSSDDMCSGYPNYLGNDVVAKCGDVYRDYGYDPIEYDNVYNNEMINFDITNFNSVMASWLTIFQVITLEGWTQLMYNYQDTVSPLTSSIFFVFVIILGAFTTLNLVLSAIMQSYLDQEKQNNAREEKDRLETALSTVNLVPTSTGEQNTSSIMLSQNRQVNQNSFQQPVSFRRHHPGLNENLSIIEEFEVSRQQEGQIEGASIEESANNIVKMSIDRGSQSVQISQERISQLEKNGGHLPMLAGNTMIRFKGIMAHQDLEDRVMIDGNPAMSIASDSCRSGGGYEHSAEKVVRMNSSSDAERFNFSASPLDNKNQNNSQKVSFNQESPFDQRQLNQSSGAADKLSERFSPSPERNMLQYPDENNETIPQNINSARASLNVLSVADEQGAVLSDEQKEIEHNAEERSQRHNCYRFFYEIVISVTFNFLIYCFILGNTITLSLYRYDQSDEQTNILYILNSIFVWVFTFEMISKIIGLGIKNYARDKFNIFDAIIVILSLVDFALSVAMPAGETSGAEGIMSAFRALRLLRVIKLARHWKAFQEILKTMISSLVDIANFSLLLLLVLFIFALLGMELFAFSAYEDINGETVFGQKNIQEAFANGDELTWPRVNFNNVFNSLVTVFIIILAEDWNGYMYLYVRAMGHESEAGRTMALFYFITLFAVGNVIMLALFTALLLKSQASDVDKLKRLIDDKEKQTAKQKLNSSEMKNKNEQEGVCDKLKEGCSRYSCNKRFSNFADSFVRIFGGESALAKRKSKRHKQDPQSNASPSSGNMKIMSKAVMPNAVMPEIKLDVFDMSEKSNHVVAPFQICREEDFPVTVVQIQEERPQEGQINQLASLLQSDMSAAKHSIALCRPHALMHYDFSKKSLAMRTIRSKTMKLTGKSCYIFQPENSLRKICAVISTNFWFEMVIILLILVSTVSLAFEHPLEDPNSDMMQLLNKIDYAFTAVFTVEATLKIISQGFILNGKKSYLLDSWNILDFIIVVFSLLGLVISADLSVVKVLRVARILRPLRLIQRAEDLKIAALAFIRAIPQIMRLQVVIAFNMFMISILMTSLLSGKLFSCNLDHTPLSFAQTNLISNKWDCLNYGGEWETAPLNFDNTLRGMLTLFIFQTREGWVGLMEQSVDAVGVDQVGEAGRNWFYVILYMVLVVIICLLFVNMLVRIVIETYNRQKSYISFNALLNDQQRSWIQVQLMTYAVKPKVAMTSDLSGFVRKFCIKIALSSYFENFIMFCILLNTVIMAMHWFDEPTQLLPVIEVFNYVFMVVFTMEAIIKLIALKKSYFQDSWNIFDFTIVCFTLFMLLLKMLNVEVPFGNGPTVLRALRIGRILRLIKRAKQLKIIFYTLFDSAATLGSLGLLLSILFFMFAVIGRSIFGMAQIGGPMEELNQHVNFRDFGTSFLLLLRCSTGESWHMIMFDYAKAFSPQYQCREEEDYESMMANGGEPKACGTALYSYLFFILFNFLVFQIFISLFVAVIIDAFLMQTDHSQLPIQNYHIAAFVEIWCELDPKGTGFIPIEDLETLIIRMCKSRDGHELIIMHEDILEDDQLRRKFLSLLQIPMYDQMKKVMFYDVVQQLCDKVNLSKFDSKKLSSDQAKARALKKLTGMKGVKDDLEIVLFAADNRESMDFKKTVQQMGSLNPKIKLMMLLQKGFKRVNETYAVYVDSSETIQMTDKERRGMDIADLREKILVSRNNQPDINLLTTRHYFAGLTVQKRFRELVVRTRKRLNRNKRVAGQEIGSEMLTNFSGLNYSQEEQDISSAGPAIINEANSKAAYEQTIRNSVSGAANKSRSAGKLNLDSRTSSRTQNTNLIVGEELERMQREDAVRNQTTNIHSTIKSPKHCQPMTATEEEKDGFALDGL